MTPDDYQQAAARTHIDAPGFKLANEEIMATWYALKLAGEVGELCNHIGKGVYHQHGVNIATVQEEAGDALWYIAGLCTIYGISLETVMRDNIAKLEKRYPSGYSSEASKARVDLKWFADPFNDPRAVQPTLPGIDAVTRASVRSPLPGDMAVCLHCNDQIHFGNYGDWHHSHTPDDDHAAEPHPF